MARGGGKVWRAPTPRLLLVSRLTPSRRLGPGAGSRTHRLGGSIRLHPRIGTKQGSIGCQRRNGVLRVGIVPRRRSRHWAHSLVAKHLGCPDVVGQVPSVSRKRGAHRRSLRLRGTSLRLRGCGCPGSGGQRFGRRRQRRRGAALGEERVHHGQPVLVVEDLVRLVGEG